MIQKPTQRLRLTDPPPELAPQRESDRVRHQRPVIAWVALDHRDAMKQLTRDAVSLRVLARSRPGSEPLRDGDTVTGVAASPDAMPAALTELLGELGPHSLVWMEGLAAMTHLRPTLSIVISGGRAITDWPRDLRAVRSELDLVLAEPRAEVLAALAASVLREADSS